MRQGKEKSPGHQTVADAKPDGLTLTVVTGALKIQYITGQATVDPMNDFTLIACLQDNGISSIAATVDTPYNTFAASSDADVNDD